jgi:hypothetical protein
LQSQTVAVSTLINNQQMLEMPLHARSLNRYDWGASAAPQNPGLATDRVSTRPPQSGRPV